MCRRPGAGSLLSELNTMIAINLAKEKQ